MDESPAYQFERGLHLVRVYRRTAQSFTSRPRRRDPVARRVDYLTDGIFAGKFDVNPRYRQASRATG